MSSDRTEQSDLIGWLRAVLDEEERPAAAEVALCNRFFPSDEFDVRYGWVKYADHRHGPGRGSSFAAGAPSPDRVLAEVEAKRRILDLHPRVPSYRPEAIARHPELAAVATCGNCYTANPAADYDTDEHVSVDWPCPTLRLLAVPYADRPGYQESWRP